MSQEQLTDGQTNAEKEEKEQKEWDKWKINIKMLDFNLTIKSKS